MRIGNVVSLTDRQFLDIGGITLGIAMPCGQSLRLQRDHEMFRVDECQCDIEITVEQVDSLQPFGGEMLFDSGGLWTLQSNGNDLVFDFSSPVAGPEPYKRMITNASFSKARLQVRDFGQGEIDPLEYPADELLVMHWLSQRRGIEVHGCGIVDSIAGGQLFIGHSGAGKSTTTRLWNSTREVVVLSDDRIILRRHAHGVRMYGTPWHGECGLASAQSAEIRRIFVLEHGTENKITRLSQSQAVAEIFARSFVPFHDPQALAQTLSYLQDMTKAIACYRFKFVPDNGVVETILNFNG